MVVALYKKQNRRYFFFKNSPGKYYLKAIISIASAWVSAVLSAALSIPAKSTPSPFTFIVGSTQAQTFFDQNFEGWYSLSENSWLGGRSQRGTLMMGRSLVAWIEYWVRWIINWIRWIITWVRWISLSGQMDFFRSDGFF